MDVTAGGSVVDRAVVNLADLAVDGSAGAVGGIMDGVAVDVIVVGRAVDVSADGSVADGAAVGVADRAVRGSAGAVAGRAVDVIAAGSMVD